MWIRSDTATAPVPPQAPQASLVAAQRTLADCLGQPVGAVEGWFGAGAFPGQVSTVRSPTFGNVTVPTVQMYSVTSVVATTADGQSLVAAVASPTFPTCFGQFQVSAVALPATAQVQVVPLSAPPGVKSYGYVTTYSLPGVGNEVVGDAFIIGDRVVTLLRASTNGPAIPSAAFKRAYGAVAGRCGARQRQLAAPRGGSAARAGREPRCCALLDDLTDQHGVGRASPAPAHGVELVAHLRSATRVGEHVEVPTPALDQHHRRDLDGHRSVRRRFARTGGRHVLSPVAAGRPGDVDGAEPATEITVDGAGCNRRDAVVGPPRRSKRCGADRPPADGDGDGHQDCQFAPRAHGVRIGPGGGSLNGIRG